MDQFENLRTWWLDNKNIWFNSTELDDIEIALKYENMFKIDCDEDFLLGNIAHGIGYIILHDQVSRHVSRAKKYPDQFIFDKLEKILGFVEKFYLLNIDNLAGYDFCFVLLPLRHTHKFDLEVYVINETWKKLLGLDFDIDFDLDNDQNELNKQIYRNYLKASYERISAKELTNFQDTEKQDKLGLVYLSLSKDYNNFHNQIEEFIEKFSDILDTTCTHYKNNYLLSNLNPNLNPDKNNKIIKEFIKLKSSLETKPNIILSISGGIDSMVLSWVLSLLKINYTMVHINYTNRMELCLKEKKMLELWANYLGVKLYFRDIDEIKRDNCMRFDLRDLYESYTRDARYQCYLDISQINNWDKNTWGILLGHNHNDSIENVLTNIANKTKYENLYGMEFISNVQYKTNQLCFIRPMLNITKKEIYNFAHEYNIPYLFDSTPAWSQRGQIRDKIIPVLNDWNKSCIDGFDQLVKITSDSIDCVSMLVDTFYDKIIWFDDLMDYDKINCSLLNLSTSSHNKFKVIKIKIDQLKPNKIFWTKFLNKIFQSNISSKSVDNFISRIELIKQKFDSLQLKQLSQINLGKSNLLDKKMYYWKVNTCEIIFGFDIV